MNSKMDTEQTIKEIKELLDKLRGKGIGLDYEIDNTYNPMESFYERTSEKEICHTEILRELLDPKGKHGCNGDFLISFMKLIGCSFDESALETLHVVKERPVNRVFTDGNGQRRIDILVTWKEKGDCAIIIENKLNNAEYQPFQLKDYKAAIESEGYVIKKCIVLQDNIENNEESGWEYFYCRHLSEWLGEFINDKHPFIYEYYHIINKKSYKEEMAEDAKKLFDLDSNTLTKTINLVKCFEEGFYRERGQRIINCIKDKCKEDDLEVVNKKDYIQLWFKNAYDENKLWIEVWFNYEKAEIYVVSDFPGYPEELNLGSQKEAMKFKRDSEESKYYKSSQTSYESMDDDDRLLKSDAYKFLMILKNLKKRDICKK